MGDIDPIITSGLLTHVGQVKQSARNYPSADEKTKTEDEALCNSSRHKT